MSKKQDLLAKPSDQTEFDVTEEEILEIASLIALIEQAEHARNYIYSRICSNIAARHGIVNKDITLNFEEIMKDGAKVAKLIVIN